MNTEVNLVSTNLPDTPKADALATTPPPADDPVRPAGYPMPKLSGPLAQNDGVGIVGLGDAYSQAIETDKRLQADTFAAMRANNIPLNDRKAGFIVSGLLFLSRFDAGQLRGEQRHQVQEVINYARARLDEFLSASKANATSGGKHPPDPVLANVRNEALAVVSKYLATDGVVVPNVKPAPHVPRGTTTI